MDFHRNAWLAGMVICLSSIPLDSVTSHARTTEKDRIKLQTELDYYKQATALNDIMYKEGTPVHMRVVVQMLKEIDKNLIKFYPYGPFTRTDFIALAMVESEFKQYEDGTHGEKGLFQIMPDEFKDVDIHKNYYNVDVNTLMAFRVLDEKYKQYKDYKVAIMAYNGLIKLKSGRYSQSYWNNFEQKRISIELVLNKD